MPKVRDAVRLFGAALVLANFPPFESCAEYGACSMARTVSIIRNTRRLAAALKSRLPSVELTTFQHGLYVTIAIDGHEGREEVRRAAGELAAEVAASGLPVKHAGSFGFDFVAVEWCADPIDGTNLIRIAGADIPLEMIDEIGDRIAAWFLRYRVGRSRHPMPTASPRRRSSVVAG